MTSHRLLRCFVWGVAAYICWLALLSGADFDDGLVAYYPFEGSGQQFEDAGENGLDGNLQTAKRERRGKFGKGCCFPIRMRKRKSRDRTLDDQEIEKLFGHNPRAFSASPVGALSTTWGDLKAAN